MTETKLLSAAEAYLMRKLGAQYPKGRTDNGGRWYPEEMLECCEHIRSPSRGYPWSYMVHCKSVDHVANEYGVDATELGQLVRRKANLPLLMTLNPTIGKWAEEKLKHKE